MSFVLDLIWVSSTVHSKQYHPYLTLSLMYFNKLCMVVFLNYLGFVTWPLNHQVGESLLVWISIINGQIGLNFRNFLVWVGSEFIYKESESICKYPNKGSKAKIQKVLKLKNLTKWKISVFMSKPQNHFFWSYSNQNRTPKIP